MESALRKAIQRFELTLLSSSKELSIRKLRSYCASLGGNGQILSCFDDWQRQLRQTHESGIPQVILYDTVLGLSMKQIEHLRMAGVFFVIDSQRETTCLTKTNFFPWQHDSYCISQLDAVFQSPVIRFYLAKRILEHKTFCLSHLMRWGHAAQTWTLGSNLETSDLALKFCRTLKLNGEPRRVTEMASHFLEVFPRQFNLQVEKVTYASDGITTGVIAELRYNTQGAWAYPQLVEEINQFSFPIAVMNHLGHHRIELAALVHFQTPVAHEKYKMFLNLTQIDHQTPTLSISNSARRLG